jgi:hypothetical protein
MNLQTGLHKLWPHSHISQASHSNNWFLTDLVDLRNFSSARIYIQNSYWPEAGAGNSYITWQILIHSVNYLEEKFPAGPGQHIPGKAQAGVKE